MITMVSGSRSIKGDIGRHIVFGILNKHITKDGPVIQGGAGGVDSIVHEWCSINAVECVTLRPISPTPVINYLYRNVEMITIASKILCIWDGQSRGTKFVIDYAQARKKVLSIEVVK